MRRTLMLLSFAVVLLVGSGCAAMIASVDTDIAIAKAAEVDVANWQTAAAARMAVRATEQAKLKASARSLMGRAATGTAALKVFDDYEVKRDEFIALALADAEQFTKALDNAVVIRELVARRMSIRAGWDALFGRIPAVATLRTLAEVEARRYVQALANSEGKTP